MLSSLSGETLFFHSWILERRSICRTFSLQHWTIVASSWTLISEHKYFLNFYTYLCAGQVHKVYTGVALVTPKSSGNILYCCLSLIHGPPMKMLKAIPFMKKFTELLVFFIPRIKFGKFASSNIILWRHWGMMIRIYEGSEITTWKKEINYH